MNKKQVLYTSLTALALAGFSQSTLAEEVVATTATTETTTGQEATVASTPALEVTVGIYDAMVGQWADAGRGITATVDTSGLVAAEGLALDTPLVFTPAGQSQSTAGFMTGFNTDQVSEDTIFALNQAGFGAALPEGQEKYLAVMTKTGELAQEAVDYSAWLGNYSDGVSVTAQVTETGVVINGYDQSQYTLSFLSAGQTFSYEVPQIESADTVFETVDVDSLLIRPQYGNARPVVLSRAQVATSQEDTPATSPLAEEVARTFTLSVSDLPADLAGDWVDHGVGLTRLWSGDTVTAHLANGSLTVNGLIVEPGSYRFVKAGESYEHVPGESVETAVAEADSIVLYTSGHGRLAVLTRSVSSQTEAVESAPLAEEASPTFTLSVSDLPADLAGDWVDHGVGLTRLWSGDTVTAHLANGSLTVNGLIVEPGSYRFVKAGESYEHVPGESVETAVAEADSIVLYTSGHGRLAVLTRPANSQTEVVATDDLSTSRNELLTALEASTLIDEQKSSLAEKIAFAETAEDLAKLQAELVSLVTKPSANSGAAAPGVAKATDATSPAASYSRTARAQAEKEATSGKILPNTGEAGSILGLLGLGIFGLGVLGRKRQQKD